MSSSKCQGTGNLAQQVEGCPSHVQGLDRPSGLQTLNQEKVRGDQLPSTSVNVGSFQPVGQYFWGPGQENCYKFKDQPGLHTIKFCAIVDCKMI